MKRPLEVALWCDCETDEEKAVFVKSGRAVDTGIIAPAISQEIGQMLAQSVRMRDALERCIKQLRSADYSVEETAKMCEEALK